jgi:Leucine-rich repeat (LRR) protein
VLDDVWNEDSEKWSELKEVLMGGASGSRILVTTRSEKVARISGTVEPYFLEGLEEDASWSLFKQLAFEKGQELEETSSMAAIGREILKKCSGIPLAIRTIGSLLRFKNSKEWSSFKDNEFSKIPQNATDIIPTLKLSYDHLPSHLKHCFAYCSLFPKDHRFDKSGLIQLWMAQGFVKSCDGQNRCLEEVGNEYFMDLLGRSFFQEARTDDFGDVDYCKMHDLMHDLAISVAGSLITTLDGMKRNLHEKTRHVSVVDYYDFDASSITTSLCKASSIRTFLCNPTSFFALLYHDSTIVDFLDCEAIFSSSKFLRVLDLHDRNHELLPSSIGKLKHLRYLDLSWNENLKKLPNCITRLQNLQTLKLQSCQNLEELPSSIGKLQHLRYLDLSWNKNLKKLPNFMSKLLNLQTLELLNCSNLEGLPRDMKELVNLRHLKMQGCNRLTYMPRGLGLLTNLQTLSKFVVHKDPLSQHSSGLKELKGLNNLRGELVIKNMRHGKDGASEWKEANLKAKQHLHGLSLQWSTEGGVNASDVNVDDEVLLEVLQPHPNLKTLRLLNNWGSRLPSWLFSHTNLVSLQLIYCKKCQYLPPLSQLPSLEDLQLHGMNGMDYIFDSGDNNEFSSSFFPSLKSIDLSFCYYLKGWWRRRDSSVEVDSDSDNSIENTENPLLPSFPCLLKLRIEDCPISSMPTFPHLEELSLDATSLKPLQQTMMMNMGAPQSPTSTATTSSSSTSLSKLKSISLYSIKDLETLPEEWLKNLTSLKSLRIWRCNRLNSLSQGIQHLAALQELNLYDCPELELANVEDEMQ